MAVIGADRVMRKFSALKAAVSRETGKANRRSGEEIMRLARILHPGDGANKAAISGQSVNGGEGFLVNFGPKAKVTEGRRGPRPFVNPALKVSRKKNKARMRRAISKAVKDTFG